MAPSPYPHSDRTARSRVSTALVTLDSLLGSDREAMLQAMQDHVLGKGEVVGIDRQATAPTK